MNEIMKIHDHKGQKVVSARELHYYLEVGRDFSTWIKDRIERFEFVENVDFVTFTKIVERAKRIEYAISIDMAKELSMVENNEKGKVARRYFIECEKKLKSTIAIPASFAEALELAAHQAREIEAKDKLIAIQAPKASYADRVLESDSQLVDVGQAAKLLKLPFGRNTFFSMLKKDGIFFKNRNEPKQEYIDSKYFDVRKKSIERIDHPDFTVLKILVTPKGLFWLSKKYNGNLNTDIPTLNAK